MRRRELKNIEWGLLIVAILLSIIGLVALFSATQEAGYDEFKKQIVWLVVSIAIMVIVMLINYELLVKLSPITTIRICKNNSNTIFRTYNIKNPRKIYGRYKQTN